MTAQDESLGSTLDDKVVEYLESSESGKTTLYELAQYAAVHVSTMLSHLQSMKSRGLTTSYECELNGEIYYKLSHG